MAASVFGAPLTAVLASRRYSSQPPLFSSLASRSVHNTGKSSIGFQRKLVGSTTHLTVTNIVTDINSVEQVQSVAAKESQRPVYPFAAIVGQDEMKLLLGSD